MPKRISGGWPPDKRLETHEIAPSPGLAPGEAALHQAKVGPPDRGDRLTAWIELKIDFHGSRVTSDGVLILVR